MSFDIIKRLRAIADYQFGRGAGTALIPEDAEVVYSKRTGRPRHVFHDGKLIATLRAEDGMFALTLDGAERLVRAMPKLPCIVVVKDEAAPHVAEGRSLFCKFVLRASRRLRAGEEVILVDRSYRVLAVGKALLSGEEMLRMKRGIAVKVRRGIGGVSRGADE